MYSSSKKHTSYKWKLQIIRRKSWSKLTMVKINRFHQKTMKNHYSRNIYKTYLHPMPFYTFWVKRSRMKRYFLGRCQDKSQENLKPTINSKTKNHSHLKSKSSTLSCSWFLLGLFALRFTFSHLKINRCFATWLLLQWSSF